MKPAAAVLLLAFAPALANAATTRARYLMGTVCEVTTSDAAQIDAAFAEAARIEALISTWREDSELSRVNRGELATPSPELYTLIDEAMKIAAQTGGAFDPLVRPLIDAWRTRADGAIPDAATVRAAVARASLSNVALHDGTIALRNGAAIEEGGFGKGYALDRMMAKISAPDVVLNFGGQLLVRGTHVVTIADPRHRDRPLVTRTIRDASLSTTSGSEKSFLVNGRRFSHVIDPRSGEALPPRGSVSVIHPSALVADALSTALYVMGPEAGLAWAREHHITAIFISETGETKES